MLITTHMQNQARDASTQGLFQIGYLFATLAVSISTGILTGYFTKFVAPSPEALFDDRDCFEVRRRYITCRIVMQLQCLL